MVQSKNNRNYEGKDKYTHEGMENLKATKKKKKKKKEEEEEEEEVLEILFIFQGDLL